MSSRYWHIISCVALLWGCDQLGGDSGSGSGPQKGAGGIAGIYEIEPNVPDCEPGQLTLEYQKRVVRRLNEIRALHQLPAVAITEAESPPAQEAALAIVANARINHGMTPDWLCYTEDGNRSSIESLLLISAGNEVGDPQDPDRVLGAWLADVGESTLGHRRWMLDPFLAQVSYGMVLGEAQVEFPYSPVIGATLDVVDGQEVDRSEVPDFVAYPHGLYPAHLVDLENAFLSFTVIADKTDRLENNELVDFTNAQITVKSGDDVKTVLDQRWYGDIIGVPNVMMWRVEGLRHNQKYEVEITNVLVNEETKEYTYDFTVF